MLTIKLAISSRCCVAEYTCVRVVPGADKAIASAAFANQIANPPADPSKAVTLCSASGIHVMSIPNYIVGTWLASFHRLPKQLHFAKVRYET